MSANNNDAKAQVQAFLEILKEQHDLDDEKIDRMVAVAQKNGKAYVTVAAFTAILIGLVAFFGQRAISAIDGSIEAIRTEILNIREKQADVRERLRAIEQKVDLHMKERP